MPKSTKDKGRNGKPLWNVPELVDKASEHYRQVHNLSWSNALYQLVIIGYYHFTTSPERYGNQYLFNDRAVEDALMDEFEALPDNERPEWVEFLMEKAFVKQGRPPKDTETE